jgi:hypothetical protein
MHDDRWFHPTRLYEYWFFIVPALLAIAFFARVWVDRRASHARDRELVRLAGNHDQANHLVSVEMAGHAGLSRELARDRLIKRLRGDAPGGPRVRRSRVFVGR